MYELKLEQFSGPIEKLLELIEEKHLAITELSLAEITADFLNYLKKIDSSTSLTIEPRLLADFVAVAAQLLLIKSKALLPDLKLTSEEEEKIKDLEGRLFFYQQFKPAINYLKELSENRNISVSRPLFFGRSAFFYPSENVKIDELYKAIKGIFESIVEVPEKQTIRSSLINLEEKIEEIIKRLNVNSRGLEFNKLTSEKSRAEIVVMFLAVLHLLANQLINIEQKNRFEDIIIGKRD